MSGPSSSNASQRDNPAAKASLDQLDTIKNEIEQTNPTDQAALYQLAEQATLALRELPESEYSKIPPATIKAIAPTFSYIQLVVLTSIMPQSHIRDLVQITLLKKTETLITQDINPTRDPESLLTPELASALNEFLAQEAVQSPEIKIVKSTDAENEEILWLETRQARHNPLLKNFIKSLSMQPSGGFVAYNPDTNGLPLITMLGLLFIALQYEKTREIADTYLRKLALNDIIPVLIDKQAMSDCQWLWVEYFSYQCSPERISEMKVISATRLSRCYLKVFAYQDNYPQVLLTAINTVMLKVFEELPLEALNWDAITEEVRKELLDNIKEFNDHYTVGAFKAHNLPVLCGHCTLRCALFLTEVQAHLSREAMSAAKARTKRMVLEGTTARNTIISSYPEPSVQEELQRVTMVHQNLYNQFAARTTPQILQAIELTAMTYPLKDFLKQAFLEIKPTLKILKEVFFAAALDQLTVKIHPAQEVDDFLTATKALLDRIDSEAVSLEQASDLTNVHLPRLAIHYLKSYIIAQKSAESSESGLSICQYLMDYALTINTIETENPEDTRLLEQLDLISATTFFEFLRVANYRESQESIIECLKLYKTLILKENKSIVENRTLPLLICHLITTSRILEDTIYQYDAINELQEIIAAPSMRPNVNFAVLIQQLPPNHLFLSLFINKNFDEKNQQIIIFRATASTLYNHIKPGLISPAVLEKPAKAFLLDALGEQHRRSMTPIEALIDDYIESVRAFFSTKNEVFSTADLVSALIVITQEITGFDGKLPLTSDDLSTCLAPFTLLADAVSNYEDLNFPPENQQGIHDFITLLSINSAHITQDSLDLFIEIIHYANQAQLTLAYNAATTHLTFESEELQKTFLNEIKKQIEDINANQKKYTLKPEKKLELLNYTISALNNLHKPPSDPKYSVTTLSRKAENLFSRLTETPVNPLFKTLKPAEILPGDIHFALLAFFAITDEKIEEKQFSLITKHFDKIDISPHVWRDLNNAEKTYENIKNKPCLVIANNTLKLASQKQELAQDEKIFIFDQASLAYLEIILKKDIYPKDMIESAEASVKIILESLVGNTAPSALLGDTYLETYLKAITENNQFVVNNAPALSLFIHQIQYHSDADRALEALVRFIFEYANYKHIHLEDKYTEGFSRFFLNHKNLTERFIESIFTRNNNKETKQLAAKILLKPFKLSETYTWMPETAKKLNLNQNQFGRLFQATKQKSKKLSEDKPKPANEKPQQATLSSSTLEEIAALEALMGSSSKQTTTNKKPGKKGKLSAKNKPQRSEKNRATKSQKQQPKVSPQPAKTHQEKPAAIDSSEKGSATKNTQTQTTKQSPPQKPKRRRQKNKRPEVTQQSTPAAESTHTPKHDTQARRVRRKNLAQKRAPIPTVGQKTEIPDEAPVVSSAPQIECSNHARLESASAVTTTQTVVSTQKPAKSNTTATLKRLMGGKPVNRQPQPGWPHIDHPQNSQPTVVSNSVPHYPHPQNTVSSVAPSPVRYFYVVQQVQVPVPVPVPVYAIPHPQVNHTVAGSSSQFFPAPPPVESTSSIKLATKNIIFFIEEPELSPVNIQLKEKRDQSREYAQTLISVAMASGVRNINQAQLPFFTKVLFDINYPATEELLENATLYRKNMPEFLNTFSAYLRQEPILKTHVSTIFLKAMQELTQAREPTSAQREAHQSQPYSLSP